jgi:hypothetical protein
MDDARVEEVRLAVYHGFARDGRAPAVAELGDRTGLTEGEARQALRRLHRSRDLVLDDPDGEQVVMAHPFSSVPLGFSVMGARTLWWGGCAWDSFALPHLLDGGPEVLVATRCPGCGTAHAWNVGAQLPPQGGQVAHFLTPVARLWDDVVRSCANQRVFCGEGCVDGWLAGEGLARGYVMDLGTLWRLARGWYAGRLDRGYARRVPAEAAAYFAEVGLRGAFWGLPAE